MSAYPHAAVSVHANEAPEARRLVPVPGDGGPMISVTVEACVRNEVWLDASGPHVRTRLDCPVSLYLTPEQAVTLASQLMRAVGRPRIEVVA